MTIRSGFNRFATGLTFALAAGIAAAQPTVPAGANPSYLSKIYERLTSRSSIPSHSNATISSSITRLADIPQNEWLRRLNNMTPAEAEEDVRGCLASLCEHKYPFLRGSEKTFANIMVLEAMFYGGLNDEEFRTYSQYLSNYQPEAALQQQDSALINTVTDILIGSSPYQNLKERLLPPSQINSTNAEEQFYLRRNFIEYMTRELRNVYGVDSIPTYLDTFPDTLNGTGAVTVSKNYIPELTATRSVLFNYRVSNSHSVEELVRTVAHEVRHTLDFDDRDLANNRNIPTDDPRFSHIAVINLNNNLYIPVCASQSYASVTCPEQYQWYSNQYIERSAVDFGERLIRALNEKLRARGNTNALRSLEPKKLQLPA